MVFRALLYPVPAFYRDLLLNRIIYRLRVDLTMNYLIGRTRKDRKRLALGPIEMERKSVYWLTMWVWLSCLCVLSSLVTIERASCGLINCAKITQ